jgi:1-acyl-sn-glycerol-3-phosphate acyltransferase
MQRTIFDTPVINTLMRWISRLILGALGWRIEGRPPTVRKYVLIAAPHTSNWDFPLTLMVCFSLEIKVYWMGKASLFPPVMGSVMRWLGGIAVDRARQGNLVQSTIDAFNQSAELIIIVPPEGTRAKVTQWKTGFYYIAQGAGLPIALGYMDYAKKIAGIETLFHPTGNIEVDLPKIQAFYSDISGKNPKQF